MSRRVPAVSFSWRRSEAGITPSTAEGGGDDTPAGSGPVFWSSVEPARW